MRNRTSQTVFIQLYVFALYLYAEGRAPPPYLEKSVTSKQSSTYSDTFGKMEARLPVVEGSPLLDEGEQVKDHPCVSCCSKVTSFMVIFLCAILFVFLLPIWLLFDLLLWLPLLGIRVAERSLLDDELNALRTPFTLMTPISLALELPLAVLSYVTYVIFSKGLMTLVDEWQAERKWTNWTDSLYDTVHEGKIDGLVLVSLASAPRWDTHTNVHIWRLRLPAGAATTLEFENVQQPGLSWQVNVRRGRKLLASCAPTPGSGDGWIKMTIPGSQQTQRVELQLRPYLFDGCESAPLPSVRMDGKTIGDQERATFTAGKLGFNHQLVHRQTLIHRAVQWHVFTFLAMQGCCCSRGVLRRLYLPLTGPETQCLYGLVHEAFFLRVETSEKFLKEHLVLVTVYNRASLPLIPSVTVDEVGYNLPLCGEDGFFAIRLVRKDGSRTEPAAKRELTVALLRRGSEAANKVLSKSAQQNKDSFLDDVASIVGMAV